MAQLNVYVAESTAEALREEAARVGLSLSRYVTMMLDRRQHQWPEGYFTERCGFLKEDFPIPPDPPAEPVDFA